MMLDDTSKTSERRLIENIVECKDPVFGDYNYNGTTGLIENIVECKVFLLPKRLLPDTSINRKHSGM